jgi:hypothetical protein
MDFRLFYSNNTATYGSGSQPALAAAPSIVRVTAATGNAGVNFQVRVAGNPAAGIQEVWVTYTATTGSLYGQWQSLSLVQSSSDSTLWVGTRCRSLNGASPKDLRFMAQAVNGVGLVSLATNQGRYYIPDVETTPTQATAITLALPASSGAYGTQATFNAVLTSGGAPLAGKPVYFSLGAQRRLAITGNDGQATANLPCLGSSMQEKRRFFQEMRFTPRPPTANLLRSRSRLQRSFQPGGASGCQ